MDSPDQNACSNRSMARRVREYKKILSIAIAQTHTEHANSPSMTAFTIQCACKNSAISETSVATGASSAGFISYVLSTGSSHVRRRGAVSEFPRRHAPRKAKRPVKVFDCHVGGWSKAGPCIPRQHVKTRADSSAKAQVSRHEAWLMRGYRGV